MTKTPTYLAHTLYRDPVDHKKLAFLVEELGRLERPSLRILEVGCGSGNVAFPLASLGHRVDATDIDATSIEFAQSRNRFPNLRFDVSDATEIAEDARYDIIVVSEVLEHLSAPEAALARFREALDPGGVLLMTVANGRGPWKLGQALSPRRLVKRLVLRAGGSDLVKKVRRKPSRHGETSTFNVGAPFVHRFTLNSFTRVASESGFRIERRAHSDGPLTFFPFTRRVRLLARLDSRLADRLPPALVSGWYFVLRPG